MSRPTGAPPGDADGAGDAVPSSVQVPAGLIILAGGAGRRLGGVDKAALMVARRTLLERMLAIAPGRAAVVVGPPRTVPLGVLVTREEPPGGGPAAGVAAGWECLKHALADPETATVDPTVLVAVLGVDQAGVTMGTLARLAAAVPADRRAGAVLMHGSRRHYAIGIFPAGALAAALARRSSWHGVALRTLIDDLVGAEVPATGDEARDVDTPADLAHWQAAWAARPAGQG